MHNVRLPQNRRGLVASLNLSIQLQAPVVGAAPTDSAGGPGAGAALH